MSFAGTESGALSLRAAATTVHRDGRWWAKCLGYGAAALTGVGLPLAAGFVMESLDNTRKGFPTPLPPWSDPSLRWLTGLFCLLIDFAFFVLPLMIGGIVLVCTSIALVMTNLTENLIVTAQTGVTLANTVLAVVVASVFLTAAFMFGVGVAPLGRLIFAREGRIEDAISSATLRWALKPPQRQLFLRARLASLPAYLPAVALGGATLALTFFAFPGQNLAVALGLWLTLSALVYAHLVVVQLYVAAEKEVQRRILNR